MTDVGELGGARVYSNSPNQKYLPDKQFIILS